MPRYDDDDDDFDVRLNMRRPRRSGPLPQSGLGLCSIAIAAFMLFAFIGLIGIAVVVEANNNAPMRDDDPRNIMLGLAVILAFGFTLVGLVLGIVACCQPDRSAVCGILGTLFNGALLFGVGFLMCLGLAMG